MMMMMMVVVEEEAKNGYVSTPLAWGKLAHNNALSFSHGGTLLICL